MDATLQSNRDTLSRLTPEEKQRLFFEGIRRPDSWPVREEYLRQEFMVNGLIAGQKTAVQTVHTPMSLAEEMVKKMLECTGELKNQKILVYNVEFLDILYRMGIMWNNEIWFVNENPLKVQWAKDIYRGDGDDHFIVQNWLDWNTTMKFDVICGNPPYQTQSEASVTNTQPLWPKFVSKSFDFLKENGYLCLVHPSGWRGFGKNTSDVRSLLRSKQIQYLELHNEKDGLSTFGAETRYDWYVIRNKPSSSSSLTTIKGEDGKSGSINISSLPFIPSGMMNEVLNLMATDGEDKVNILSDCAYHTQKEYVSKIQSSEFKYPCAYSINVKGEPTFHFSSTNEKGHFGIPKVIFAGGRIASANYVVDINGKYGLTQFAHGIVDSPKILPLIAAAMRTSKFKRMMEMCAFRYEISRDVMATFRKDFWKQFVDESGNELP